MTDGQGKRTAAITSIEASEEAVQIAEGRAMAVELLASLRRPNASPLLLLELVKREARNAWSDYRLRGLCLHLQQELSGAAPSEPAPQRP